MKHIHFPALGTLLDEKYDLLFKKCCNFFVMAEAKEDQTSPLALLKQAPCQGHLMVPSSPRMPLARGAPKCVHLLPTAIN